MRGVVFNWLEFLEFSRDFVRGRLDGVLGLFEVHQGLQ